MKATHQPSITTADPAPTPALLLRVAAIYLVQCGWTTHQFYDLAADQVGPFPPACTSGAIMTVATGRCLASGMCSIDGDEDAEITATIRAMRVFAAHIDPEYSMCGSEQPHTCDRSAIDIIGDWNDADGRTLDEVLEALTDAADEWDAIHTPGGAR